MRSMENTWKTACSCLGPFTVLSLGVFWWEAAPGWVEKLLGGQQKGHVGNKGQRASLSHKRVSGRWVGYGNLLQSGALSVLTPRALLNCSWILH